MYTQQRMGFSFIPRDVSYFDMFIEAGENVHTGAMKLNALLDDYHDVEEKQREIKRIEHAGDEMTHNILEKLNTTFLAPIDRDDIHRLVTRLDDIIDLIDECVSRMHLYKIDNPTEASRKMASVLVDATQLIVEALRELKAGKYDPIKRKCIEIHTQENEGDRLEQHALSSLFEDGHTPVEIIKWKDVYEDLEGAIDRTEDVANILEAIVLKNA